MKLKYVAFQWMIFKMRRILSFYLKPFKKKIKKKHAGGCKKTIYPIILSMYFEWRSNNEFTQLTYKKKWAIIIISKMWSELKRVNYLGHPSFSNYEKLPKRPISSFFMFKWEVYPIKLYTNRVIEEKCARKPTTKLARPNEKNVHTWFRFSPNLVKLWPVVRLIKLTLHYLLIICLMTIPTTETSWFRLFSFSSNLKYNFQCLYPTDDLFFCKKPH